MERYLQPELLDELAPEDPRAIGSRRDLRRLNWWMGRLTTIVARMLRSAFQKRALHRLVELGAGDGCFALGVAQRLGEEWQGRSVTLLDRQSIVGPEVGQGFAQLGWNVETLQADVFEWLRQPPEFYDAIIINLFLHHFSDAQLAELFRSCAERAQMLIALEPRRSVWTLAVSRLVGLIGCNQVTRHDAPASVRAGFAGEELSRLWPTNGNWMLQEGSSGVFSHLFVAQRINPAKT